MQKRHIAPGSQECAIPDYAHKLIKLFTSSLYVQDTIYTKNTKRITEQWVEFVVRFYLFDKTKEQKRITFTTLKTLQVKVHDMLKCAFQFHDLLQKNKTDAQRLEEKKIEHCWSLLYNNMSTTVSKQKGRKKTVVNAHSTKKKHCA